MSSAILIGVGGAGGSIVSNVRTNVALRVARAGNAAIWQAEAHQSDETPALTLTYLSRDGEEGYPGELTATVVYLLDSLYGQTADFEAWAAGEDRRLVVVYTDGGGTVDYVRDLKRGPNVSVERAERPHEAVPRAYFGRLLAGSGIAKKG